MIEAAVHAAVGGLMVLLGCALLITSGALAGTPFEDRSDRWFALAVWVVGAVLLAAGLVVLP